MAGDIAQVEVPVISQRLLKHHAYLGTDCEFYPRIDKKTATCIGDL